MRAGTGRARGAALWRLPPGPLFLILGIELGCGALLAGALVHTHGDSWQLGRFALILLMAAAYAEGSDRIERLRRYVGYVENSMFINAASLWCFAGALVLPVGLAGALAALLYAHTVVRAVRHRAGQPYRLVYTAATEVIAAMAAAAVVGALGGGGPVLGVGAASVAAAVAALATYAAVNQGLVLAVLLMVRRGPMRTMLLSGQDEMMEFVTLALGVLLAVAVAHAPLLAPFTVPLIAALRRSALVHQLQVQATRDDKTGLLNAGAWRQAAQRELVRAERVGTSMSLLMIDLDHFKQLNDRHGHPAGDATLKAIGECLSDALRGYDAIGRFGGEEFVALLCDADERVSTAVAERLCARIRALRLPHGDPVTASIGVGLGVPGLHGLDDLIEIADRALYAAKHAGRDRVRLQVAALPEPSGALERS